MFIAIKNLLALTLYIQHVIKTILNSYKELRNNKHKFYINIIGGYKLVKTI